MTFQPYLEYQPRTDAAVLHLRDTPVARVHAVDARREAHYDAAGGLVMLRFAGASDGMYTSGLPEQDEIDRTMAEAVENDPRTRAAKADPVLWEALQEAAAAVARGEKGVPLRQIQAEEAAARQAGERV